MPDTLLIVLLAAVALIVLIILFKALTSKDDSQEADQQPSVSDSVIPADDNPVDEPADAGAKPDSADDSDALTPSPDGDDGAGDTLTQIKGLGAKAEAKLRGIGVARFDQIASWTQGDIETIDAKFGLGKRIERDRWIEQAGLLARGEIAAFEAKFGKLDRGAAG